MTGLSYTTCPRCVARRKGGWRQVNLGCALCDERNRVPTHIAVEYGLLVTECLTTDALIALCNRLNYKIKVEEGWKKS